MSIDLIKGITSEKKTTLPSLGNQDLKTVHVKQTIKLEEINQNVLVMKVRLKDIKMDKIIQTKQDIRKQQEKHLPASRGRMHANKRITKKQLFWSKKWVKKRGHNRKVKWIKNMEKELREREEGPKIKTHLDSLRATFKKYQIGKGRAMMIYMDSGFKKSLSSTADWRTK